MSATREPQHYQYCIVGAGASGLWLALAMLEEGLLEHGSLCIVEAEANKANDRTWCYWAPESIQSGDLPQDEWRIFKHPSKAGKLAAIAPYRYFHLRSADFYAFAKSKLQACANVHWMQAEVSGFDETEGKVLLHSTAGRWSSSHVFISAMPRNDTPWSAKVPAFLQNEAAGSPLLLWQSFVGWRVRSTEPIFRKDAATLMHFDIDQLGSTQFIYELPFSANEALVELTRFGEKRLSKEEALPLLEAQLAQLGGSYEIMEWEVGAIPMTPMLDMRRRQLPHDSRVVFIGTPGGAVKPTTGYAFKRMEAYARHLAKALKAKTALPTMQRKWRFRLYDILLLQILRDKAHRGREVFLRLFDTQPLPRVLKFLDEETSLVEEMLIFSRMPKRLFLLSLLKYIRKA